MALDNEKFIASQAILKSLIESLPDIQDDNLFYGKIRTRFQHCIKIAEDYATINPDDEWINSGCRVPTRYWDTRNEEFIGEGNRPQKTEKGWFVFVQKKKIAEFKKFIEEKEGVNGPTI